MKLNKLAEKYYGEREKSKSICDDIFLDLSEFFFRYFVYGLTGSDNSVSEMELTINDECSEIVSVFFYLNLNAIDKIVSEIYINSFCDTVISAVREDRKKILRVNTLRNILVFALNERVERNIIKYITRLSISMSSSEVYIKCNKLSDEFKRKYFKETKSEKN